MPLTDVFVHPDLAIHLRGYLGVGRLGVEDAIGELRKFKELLGERHDLVIKANDMNYQQLLQRMVLPPRHVDLRDEEMLLRQLGRPPCHANTNEYPRPRRNAHIRCPTPIDWQRAIEHRTYRKVNTSDADLVREVVALVRVNTAMLDTMLVGGFLRDAARNVAWLEELGGTWLPNNRHWYELNSFCYAVKDSYPPACPLFQTAAVAARMLHTHPESEGFFEECDEILRFVERCQRAEEPRTQPVSDIQRLYMDEEPA